MRILGALPFKDEFTIRFSSIGGQHSLPLGAIVVPQRIDHTFHFTITDIQYNELHDAVFYTATAPSIDGFDCESLRGDLVIPRMPDTED